MSDCERPDYYNHTEPVARKKHKCCECSAPILPGEKYLQVNASWEHEPGTYRQHLLCAEACEFVRDTGMNDDECLFFGYLKEWWKETMHEWSMTEKEDRAKLWRLMLRIKRRERNPELLKEGKP